MSNGSRVLLTYPEMPISYTLLTELVEYLNNDGIMVPCQVPSRIDWYADGRRNERAAAAACMTCPAVLLCDAYATEADEWGVWGARTRKQRREGVYPQVLLAMMRIRVAVPA